MSRPFLRYHWEKILKAGAPCKKCKKVLGKGWKVSVLYIYDEQEFQHYFICESCSIPPGLKEIITLKSMEKELPTLLANL